MFKIAAPLLATALLTPLLAFGDTLELPRQANGDGVANPLPAESPDPDEAN